jgi:hypothetical protein
MSKHVNGRPLTVDEYTEWNTAELARRTVSRRSMIKATLGGAGGLVVAQFALANSAFAASGGTAGKSGVVVTGRHLSWVNDHNGDPTNAMRATAQLVSSTGTLPRGLWAEVEVGQRPGQYGLRVAADIVHLLGQYAIAGGPVASQFYAKAEIFGLKPDTLYHYRFRLSDGTVTGDAYFTTAPSRTSLGTSLAAPKPFTFTAFADVGTNVAPTDPRWAWGHDPSMVTSNKGTWPVGAFDNNYYSATDPVAGPGGTDLTPAITQTKHMATQRPVFTLLAGDICYADPSGSGLPADDSGVLTTGAPVGKNEYNPYVWDVFLNQIESQAAYTPWMFATGNHDMEALYSKTRELGDSPTHGYASHAARLDLPKNGPKTCPSVYSFVYANVGVISVDANDLSYEIQTNTGYSAGAQLRFLEETLANWRTNPHEARTVDFIVAFFHHCAYSTTANHGSDGGVRAALDPLFSKYQVDLVVQGHNHILERTDPIKFGKRTRAAADGSTIHPAVDGVTYMCVGSGGRPRYAFQPAPSSSAPPAPGTNPSGPQLLKEGQRYRGYKPAGGANTGENNTETVVNSYVWSDAGTAVNSSGYLQGTKVPEEATWSQVRYDDYAFIAVDVVPARVGHKTTFTVRTLADSLPGSSAPMTEIDRITFERVAGENQLQPSLVSAAGSSLLAQH